MNATPQSVRTGWRAWLLIACAVGVVAASSPASLYAQNRLQTERGYVLAPSLVAMGNAGVAAPRSSASFFYNPAFLSHTGRQFFLAGLQGQFSLGLSEQVQFFTDRLQPALDDGLDTLPAAQLEDLYTDAIDIGHRPSTLNATLLLPALTWQQGPLGLGVGFFSSTGLTYRLGTAGLGVPLVDLVGRTDWIGRAGGSLDLAPLGIQGLTVGLMGAVTRRYLTFKDKPLDAVGEGESVLILKGTAVGLDVGVLYDVPGRVGPGRFSVAAALYDAETSGFDYTFHGTAPDLPLLGRFFDPTTASVGAVRAEQEVRRARERHALSASYRLGAAYRIQDAASLPETVLAIDYVGYEDAPVDQSFLARLHAGVDVSLASWIALRTGLSAGYPTAGLGLSLAAVQVHYAFHGVEHGRIPGQIPSYQHVVQLAVELF